MRWRALLIDESLEQLNKFVPIFNQTLSVA
jgi:hypothetical protein